MNNFTCDNVNEHLFEWSVATPKKELHNEVDSNAVGKIGLSIMKKTRVVAKLSLKKR